jgi:A/G-specific adenine glycosylase
MAFNDIIVWFENHKRLLSFRQTNDPYKIWISEIMLQQTQVVSMLPYYDKFIKIYPTVESLAHASLEDVLQHVKGMGYYRRFKLMHQCAIVIKEKYHSQFPNTHEAIITLPGIGMYTAGAIMSIAFKKPYSALDGNVMRVLTRVFSINSDIRLQKTQKELNVLNQSLIVKTHPDIYTHAMMEIGATICKPAQPVCEACPLSDICLSYKENTMHLYPYKSKAKEKKEYHLKTLLVINEKQEILIKKETQQLFEGMYLFPQYEYEHVDQALEKFKEAGIEAFAVKECSLVKHVFTHQVWHMSPVICTYKSGAIHDYIWYPIQALKDALMPVAHSKLHVVLKQNMRF